MYKKLNKADSFGNVICNLRDLSGDTFTFGGTPIAGGKSFSISYDGESISFGNWDSEIDLNLNYNDGFSNWAIKNKEKIKNFLKGAFDQYCFDGEVIYIYGHWSGKGVVENVALSELDASFFVSDVIIYVSNKVVHIPLEYLFPSGEKPTIENFWSIEDFGILFSNVDLSNVDESKDFFKTIEKETVDNCAIAHRFGIEGVGLGFSWKYYCDNGEILKFNLK